MIEKLMVKDYSIVKSKPVSCETGLVLMLFSYFLLGASLFLP